MKIKYISIFLCLGLFRVDLFGHEVVVHQAITANAAAVAQVNSPAFGGFINIISLDDRSFKQATNKMVFGSGEEDDNAKQDPVGGKRSYNHFYDPLDTTYGKGLTDVPNDRRSSSPVGNNSFVWGSIYNCIGIDYYGEFYTYLFQNNINTKNIWSWQNARSYEWLGLTATNKVDRQANLDNMFRAVGQVMHLLEDTSQPQHVRNKIIFA